MIGKIKSNRIIAMTANTTTFPILGIELNDAMDLLRFCMVLLIKNPAEKESMFLFRRLTPVSSIFGMSSLLWRNILVLLFMLLLKRL